MDFIISRFLKMLERDYGLTFESMHNADGSYSIMILDLAEELRNCLLEIQITNVVGHKTFRDRNDDIIRTEPIINSYRLAANITFNDGRKAICIHMDDATYAQKINKIDFCLRRYFEEHSKIDAINGND